MCPCGREARAEDVLDGAGLALARRCRRCSREVEVRCFVCLGWFRNLVAHHTKSPCGEHYRAGRWWRAVQPTRLEVVVTVNGGQLELFS